MAKVRPISGFPEWLPEQRLVEQEVLDGLRSKFELFGFAPIETRSVEPLDTLLAKGETDKEIYVLRRLGAGADEGDAGFGLHFDLTVPFARYAVQFYNELTFPFKRYQIQKAWRGERPQEGRYREFLQADIDVIDRGSLALSFDAEILSAVHHALAAAPFPPIVIHVNNRKITEGFMRGLGIEDPVPVMRVLDKLDKVGPDGVRAMLDLADSLVDKLLELVQTPLEEVRGLGVSHELLDEGLEELRFVLQEADGVAVADMGVVRGFDYYTGTVYESVMQGHEGLGAVCSGGRYDNLAAGAREKLPGVGISIGVSRILGRLFGQDAIPAGPKTPTQVLVALTSEEERTAAGEVARGLRARGIATEVFHEPVKFGKQIAYADGKGIPYVWFTDSGEVKDLRTGEQRAATVDGFAP